MWNSKNLISFLVFLFLLTNISATIVANSSSFTIGMFGTGMATGTPTSTNYNLTFLTEDKGTTAGAISDNYFANIGFFENPYTQTVSINSYSVTSSATVGSTIALYISATNADSVWAVVTAPNSQTQTITLINGNTVTFLPTPSVIGTYTVVFYANSSTGAITSVVDSFILTDVTPPTPPSGGGGGSCTYLWNCSAWSVCEEGTQTRTCENIGTCSGETGKPEEERNCSDALFDVALKFENLVITENQTLKFDVHLIEQLGIEKIDVQVRYSVMDDIGTELFSQTETKAVQGNLSYTKELEELKLVDGEYILRVDILYGNQQKAYAEQRFEVKIGGIKIIPEEQISRQMIVFIASIIFLIMIIIFIIIILWITRRRKKKEICRPVRIKKRKEKKTEKSLKEILRNEKVIIFSFVVSVIGFLLAGNQVFTGFAIGESYAGVNLGFVGLLLLVGLFTILFIQRERIKETAINAKDKINRKELPINSVKGLMKRKVYTEKGDLVGEIKEISFEDNRISELRIELDKKVRKKESIKAKGFAIKYKEIEATGKIIIIADKIWGHLKK